MDCNRCGKCCSEQLCPAAEIAFPDTVAPCPALSYEGGLAECGMILVERHFSGGNNLSHALGIGIGCTYN